MIYLAVILPTMFFIFLLWLAAPAAFSSFAAAIILFTLLFSSCLYLLKRQRQKTSARFLQAFLQQPTDKQLRQLHKYFDPAVSAELGTFAEQLQAAEQQLTAQQQELLNYQTYIEAWVHETKTPLSLALLVLNNHPEEMSPYVFKRMEHVRQTISENVEQILYYARLQKTHVDYHFEKIQLDQTVADVLEEFQILIEEKKLAVTVDVPAVQIVSDQKVLAFLLRQLVSNAVKYAADDEGKLTVSAVASIAGCRLLIANNGQHVRTEDLPFIFDKGFTGARAKRQQATGMGLYFVKEYGELLGIKAVVKNERDCFMIELLFPEITV